MLYKILIIDDNHSFIDSLRVMLKEFPFQYDSSFRFIEARKKIEENGVLLKNDVKKTLQDYDIALKEWEERNAALSETSADLLLPPPEKPDLSESHINEEGYLLVVLEQDTEASLKGTAFIQNIIRTYPNFSEQNFIILTSNAKQIDHIAKEVNVTVVEKPIKNQAFRQIIVARLQQIEESIKQTDALRQTILATNPNAMVKQEEEKPKKPNLIDKKSEAKTQSPEPPKADTKKTTKSASKKVTKKAAKKTTTKKSVAKKSTAKKAVKKAGTATKKKAIKKKITKKKAGAEKKIITKKPKQSKTE